MMDKIPKTSIKDWAEDDKPREKLLNKGPAALSNAELIAILIGSGNNEESAVALSKRIMNEVNDNFAELARLTISDLQKYKGIGEAKAITIAAALELGRRRGTSVLNEKPQVKDSKTAFILFQKELGDLNYENFCVLLLNRANKVLKIVRISDGGITGTVVDQRKVFKVALDNNATSIILGHNHPSGQLTPSAADIDLTKKMKAAGETLDLPVLDHIIVGDGNYYSFADEGIM
ncbi:MAG: DNA repair protein RadC [Bacteroidales bacterium]|nr:DNA repair protein RadC [Bacteroidales bacterium]